jgi:PEP-CTERM motif
MTTPNPKQHMKGRKSTTLPVAAIVVLLLSLPLLQAAQFSVHLVDQTGPTIDGIVDTTTDTFAIGSWVSSPSATTWTPALTQFPLALRAYSFNGGSPYDVPDNWNGTISGWAFLLQPPQDNHRIQWQQGTLVGTVASFGWGGFRGYNGFVGPLEGGGNRVFPYVPSAPDTVTDVVFDTVSIALVPEPSTMLLIVGGVGAVYFLRRRNHAAYNRCNQREVDASVPLRGSHHSAPRA